MVFRSGIYNIDLHRHHGGAISPQTVWDILNRDSQTRQIADSLEQLTDMMTFRNDTNYKFHHFLSKFDVLNYVRWDEEAIDLSVKQVCSDLNKEGVVYCELRFSIDKYLSFIPWDEHEACLFFLDCIRRWSDYYNITIGPILCIKHECPAVYQTRISKLINHWRVAEQLAGIDFVGNEAFFGRKRLRDTFRHWRLCGKGTLIHVGEWGSAENIRYAIDYLRPTRIAHGIKIVNDADLMKRAVDENIVFDVSVTSNVITGVSELLTHPIVQMYNAGCQITIGTDDPVTFDITLKDEYDNVSKVFGEREDMHTIINKFLKQSWISKLDTKIGQ